MSLKVDSYLAAQICTKLGVFTYTKDIKQVKRKDLFPDGKD